MTKRPTAGVTGGRDRKCGAEQLHYRAACLQAAHAARPLEPVLGRFLLKRYVINRQCGYSLRNSFTPIVRQRPIIIFYGYF